MIEVIPAVNPSGIEEIEKKISLVKDSVGERVQKIQLDFVDGKYAPPVTWPFNLSHEPAKDFKLPFSEEVILEADLLIKHPEDWIEDFVRIGIKSFVIHLDSTSWVEKSIHLVKSQGRSLGIGIKPSSDIKLLDPFLKEIDFVQFMGNDKVGYNGVSVPLDRKVLRKIAEFHANHSLMPIQIDIGVNELTAPELVRAGVSRLVSGSAVFSGENIAENIEKLSTS